MIYYTAIGNFQTLLICSLQSGSAYVWRQELQLCSVLKKGLDKGKQRMEEVGGV